MSGVSVTIHDHELQQTLGSMLQRLADTTPAMRLMGDSVVASVQRNFQVQGRPTRWKALSPVTVQRRGASGPILRRLGFAGGLAGSVSAEATRDKVVVGTNKPYAAVHQFGARKGQFGTVLARVPAHKRTTRAGIVTVQPHTRKVRTPWGAIPARPFLMVQPGDWEEMVDGLKTFISGGTA